ncbi:MAG: hypothetical protein LBL52_00105 [Rickettsiales bacterium]|jgi:hypothetical protein|nr:hypothetical protein [Rickettsiales bacterium]
MTLEQAKACLGVPAVGRWVRVAECDNSNVALTPGVYRMDSFRAASAGSYASGVMAIDSDFSGSCMSDWGGVITSTVISTPAYQGGHSGSGTDRVHNDNGILTPGITLQDMVSAYGSTMTSALYRLD